MKSTSMPPMAIAQTHGVQLCAFSLNSLFGNIYLSKCRYDSNWNSYADVLDPIFSNMELTSNIKARLSVAIRIGFNRSLLTSAITPTDFGVYLFIATPNAMATLQLF